MHMTWVSCDQYQTAQTTEVNLFK
uniref:Uncharacterized protein n=1 Tax=Anguilla anguilla TaxID=7936 RepID=A0A0E9RQW0_ANGAN